MRIALVHPYTWPHTRRGAERYLHDLAWYLSSAGHEVTILSSSGGRDEPGTDDADGVEIRRVWARPGGRVRSLPFAVRTRIEERRIAAVLHGPWDVVHALWPAGARAAAAHYPTVYTLLGMPTAETDPQHRSYLARGAAAATVTAALSTPAFEEARRLMPGRWTVLPPGIRTARFPQAPPPGGNPKILFSASLSTKHKGLPVVLRAFADILRHRPDVELILSGSGSHLWALDELDTGDRERVVTRLRVAGVGTLDDADSLYAQASVMVLPSRHEAFGLSVVEALSTGCPVVVADDGGPREIIGEAGVGDALPHDDAAGIAKAALTWIDRSARREVRDTCRARACRFDWNESIGPMHEAIYEAARRGEAIPRWSGDP